MRRQRWQRTVMRRRRSFAAMLAGGSVLLALTALHPAPSSRPAGRRTVTVLVAAHDLTAGAVLHEADTRTEPYPAGLVPDGVLMPGDAAAGRRLVLPVRAGEPLTDVRFVSDALLDRLSGPGSVAAPVRIADAGEVALVRPGDHVDVLAAPASDTGSDRAGDRTSSRSQAVPVASNATVLSVPQAAPTGVADGGLVVLAVPSETARALAGAATSERLSLVLRP
jgi:Flp pilus assembly protein CpaB